MFTVILSFDTSKYLYIVKILSYFLALSALFLRVGEVWRQCCRCVTLETRRELKYT